MAIRTGVLPNSPLKLSIASVRYAPWLRLPKELPEIQEALRDKLPSIQHFQVAKQGNNGFPEPSSIWTLTSSDATLSLALSQDQLLLTCNSYSHFHEFRGFLETILRVVFRHMGYMHVLNLGIRYVDIIQPRENEKLEDYLCPPLLPAKFSGTEGVGGKLSFSLKRGDEELRVRCTSFPNSPALPEDLLPWMALTNVPLGTPLEVEKLTRNAMLDMDAVRTYEKPEKVENEAEILNQISSLHNFANSFFRSPEVITDHAFLVWKNIK